MEGINETTILRWWEIFKGEHPLTEVRILDGGVTYSGYFDDVHQMLQAIAPFGNKAIYGIVNIIDPACFSRKQSGKIIRIQKDEATGDNHVIGRTMFLVDLDPKRVSGVNATDAEKHEAYEVMRKVGVFMQSLGFTAPVVADSGNGYHLYYRIALRNTQESTQLMKDCLEVLNDLFSTDKVDIDTSVFNAARISKLIGTSSRKGTDTPERPQRESYFVKVPPRWEVTDITYLRKLASLKPVPETPSYKNDYGKARFDVEAFFEKHNISVHSREEYKGGVRYILDECPWDSSHKDAAVIQRSDGILCYHCFHNSCSQYGWKDFRQFYEPDAYSRSEYDDYQRKREYNDRRRGKNDMLEALKVEPEAKPQGGPWKKASDIVWVDPRTFVYAPTGILALDQKTRGLMLPSLTVLSGIAGSGKSTFIDELICSVVQAGFPTAVFSGELSSSYFMDWLHTIAAGPDVTKVWRGQEVIYSYADKEISQKIDRWLDSKGFWLYNNDYGFDWSKLFPYIQEAVEQKGAKVLILDNLMVMNLDYYGERNDLQGQFVKILKKYCEQWKIAVFLVCHPRKEMTAHLLRMQDISGSADLYNVPDNVFLLHRVGTDFEKRAADFWGKGKLNEILASCYNSVLEVVKCRYEGKANGLLCGLYYNAIDRRLENTPNEDYDFGWKEYIEPEIHYTGEDMPDFSGLDDLDDDIF
jgi:KaiC/GvpD/RAD55 family RecA-like ATPase